MVPRTPSELALRGRWSRKARDRWFLGLFAASILALFILVSPFAYVLFFALVTTIVAWPLYERILVACGGRRVAAAVLTMFFLSMVVGGPALFFVFLFVQQALGLVGQGLVFVKSGQLDAWVQWGTAMVPAGYDDVLVAEAQKGALSALGVAGAFVPTLLGTTATASVGAVVYFGAVLGFFMNGPWLLETVKLISPIEARYERRLFEVFRELAQNMVVGALAIAVIQGCIAGLGYALLGVERPVFFAVLTGAFSFLPFIGTTVVWVPLVIFVGVTDGPQWAAALFLWNALFTVQIDNFVRPLFLRGRNQLHPLFVGLCAFGGLAWMGVPGALIGPVLAAVFLALLTIYVEDFVPDGEGDSDLGTLPARVPTMPPESQPRAE